MMARGDFVLLGYSHALIMPGQKGEVVDRNNFCRNIFTGMTPRRTQNDSKKFSSSWRYSTTEYAYWHTHILLYITKSHKIKS